MTFIMPGRTAVAAGTPDKKMFHGIYLASVVSTKDPNRQNRVTMKIPQVLGAVTSNWANSVNSTQQTPQPGDIVYAMFTGGDINQPVYLEEVTIPQGTPWTQLTPLGTGWSASGGVSGVFYRLSLTGDVCIAWDIQTTTNGNANTIATLPSGFRPSTSIQLQCGWIGGPTGYSSAFEPSVNIATSGAITVQGIPSFAGTLELFGTSIVPIGSL